MSLIIENFGCIDKSRNPDFIASLEERSVDECFIRRTGYRRIWKEDLKNYTAPPWMVCPEAKAYLVHFGYRYDGFDLVENDDEVIRLMALPSYLMLGWMLVSELSKKRKVVLMLSENDIYSGKSLFTYLEPLLKKEEIYLVVKSYYYLESLYCDSIFAKAFKKGIEVFIEGRSSKEFKDAGAFEDYVWEQIWNTRHLTRELDAKVFHPNEHKILEPYETTLEQYLQTIAQKTVGAYNPAAWLQNEKEDTERNLYDLGRMSQMIYVDEEAREYWDKNWIKNPEFTEFWIKELTEACVEYKISHECGKFKVLVNGENFFDGQYRRYPIHQLNRINGEWKYYTVNSIKNCIFPELLREIIYPEYEMEEKDISRIEEIFAMVLNCDETCDAEHYWEHICFFVKYTPGTKTIEICNRGKALLEFHELLQKSTDYHLKHDNMEGI